MREPNVLRRPREARSQLAFDIIWCPCLFSLKKNPFLKTPRPKFSNSFKEKKPKVASPWAGAAALSLALFLHTGPGIYLAHSEQGRVPAPLAASKILPSHCPGPGTQGDPEFPLSSTHMRLGGCLQCRDTGGLEAVFPGCFGISSKKKVSETS